MCGVFRMSMLGARKRNYTYIGSPIYVLFGKYEPHSKEYFRTTLYLNMTGIPWRGNADTGEIYWNSWCRNVTNRVSLIGCLI